MAFWALAVLLLSGRAWCAPPEFEPRTLYGGEGAWIRGGVLRHDPAPVLAAFGDGLAEVRLPSGEAVRHRPRVERYGEGGCLADVDRDGVQDLVLLRQGQGGRLGQAVWLPAGRHAPRIIDTAADFRDCLPATLDGRHGVLLIHRRMQVRFYEPPAQAAGAWPYRELYSIYTPSAQGGLMLADVDGDSLEDIFCGNYWIRNPGRLELSWRLFAIQNWWEQERSAMVRLALAPLAGSGIPDLVASQSEVSPARLAWFERPADPVQFWIEHRLEAPRGLRFPRALAVADVNGDRFADIVVGENNGLGSRLLLFENSGKRTFEVRVIGEHEGLVEVWVTDLDGDGDPDLLGLGPASVTWWRNQRRR